MNNDQLNFVVVMLLCGVMVSSCAFGDDQPEDKTFVAVFDFVTLGNSAGKQSKMKRKDYGAKLADSVRLKLRKQGPAWQVIDRLTTADASGPIGCDAKTAAVKKILTETLGAHVGVFGQLQKTGNVMRAEISCIDIRKLGGELVWTTKVFSSDDPHRSRAIIAAQIVEALTGQKLWKPPEYGDHAEPDFAKLGKKPLNKNGSFDKGSAGWDAADNVSTFYQPGPAGRGGVLRVRTDLKREPWLAYRKAIRLGKAPKTPPKIPTDTSYSCVGGLEGVHVRSEWIKAQPGMQYWLTADVFPVDTKSNPSDFFFPKVFVKGFRKTPHAMDGLPESSLAQLGITPKQFAAMDESKRRKLIAADAKRHPMRYLRECYRWYLPCRSLTGQWTHLAAPFPPRGGLPKNVEYLQIQIYTYWPAGTYLWDNVNLYADPNSKKPIAEVKARTKNFGRTSDVVEQESKK